MWVCKPRVTLVGPVRSLQLESLLRVVLAWAELARPLHFSIPQALHVGCLGKLHDFGQQRVSTAEASSIASSAEKGV